MSSILSIEDLYLRVIDLMDQHRLGMQYHDRSASRSFYTTLYSGREITENQGKYILKIIHKYRNSVKPYIDVEEHMKTLRWKKPFRVIDKSRKVWLEDDRDTGLEICLKFPYDLKDEYESEFVNTYTVKQRWDGERRLRAIDFYSSNVMQVYEFCKKHEFEFDQSFLDAVDKIEEIWQNTPMYQPYCEQKDGKVVLNNTSYETEEFFESKQTGDLETDLIIAKTMGIRYSGPITNQVENIAYHKGNSFWVKHTEDFIKLGYAAPGKVALLLDRSADILHFMKRLATSIDNLGYDRDDFRVCFRASNKEDPEFNEWVRENGFGGKIEPAKFVIFKHKPAKWLFKQENDVTIVATNNIMPPTFQISRNWLRHSPIVLYVGDINPNEGIVEIAEL